MADESTKAVSGKAKKYRVSPRTAYKFPNMVTLVPLNLDEQVGGKIQVVSVSLGAKEVRRTLPATTERPEVEMISKPASQAQLKYLYEVEKHPLIEEYEE